MTNSTTTNTSRALEIQAPPGEPTITFTRFVKATPGLVYKVFTECEHVARWWGPRAMTLSVCENDLRVGGKYRWVLRSPEGFEAGFHGEYRELDRPNKIVNTWIFEGAPDHEAMQSAEFRAVEGGTLIVALVVHDSVESRDMHLASGMESGTRESYERLDELLGELTTAQA